MVNGLFYPSRAVLNTENLASLPAVLGVVGDLPDAIVHAAELHESGAGCIGFLKDQEYLDHLEQTTLSAVIVPKKFQDRVPEHCLAVISAEPRVTFAAVLSELYPQVFDTVPQNPSAQDIDPSAKIGAGVRLGRGVIIGAHVEIGQDSQIGDYTIIGDHVRLGKNCRIGRHNTIRYTLAGDGFWCDDHNAIGCAGFAFEPYNQRYYPVAQVGLLRIGDGVHVTSGCSIDRGALGDTIIEDSVQIESLSKIGHNVYIGFGTAIVGLCAVAGSADIGRGVRIAGKVGVNGFTTVGDGATIMACSAVTKDVAAGVTVFGVPAIELKEFGAQAHEIHKLVRATKKKKNITSRA